MLLYSCKLPGATLLEDAVVAAFERRGARWRGAEGGPSDGRVTTDLVWVPYSALRWGPSSPAPHAPCVALYEGGTAKCASSHPVRTALVSKAGLAETMEELLRLSAAALAHLDAEAGDAPSVAAVETLTTFRDSWLPCHVLDLSVGRSLLPQVRVAVGGSGSADQLWVVKLRNTNNALGVHFVPQSALPLFVARLAASLQDASAQGGGDGSDETFPRLKLAVNRLSMQAYAPFPLLIDGSHKFHVRLNVLLLGKSAVYVHGDAVVHVACEPLYSVDPTTGAFCMAPVERAFAHVTNNVLQRQYPSFTPANRTLLLPAACARMTSNPLAPAGAPVCPAALLSGMLSVVRVLFGALLLSGTAPAPGDGALSSALHSAKKALHPALAPLKFAPSPSSFELFGLDFLVCHHAEGAAGSAARTWRPILLEVNAGPALESRAWPSLAAVVVEDTLQLVADEWAPATVRGWPGEVGAPPPLPAAGNGFVRVW